MQLSNVLSKYILIIHLATLRFTWVIFCSARLIKYFHFKVYLFYTSDQMYLL